MGGLWTIFLVLGGTAFVSWLIATSIVNQAPSAVVSNEPLLGEFIQSNSRDHVLDMALMTIFPGQPPVGGRHLPTPQPPGVYGGPISDGQAVHALEHGIVWLSYDPAKLDRSSVDALANLQRKYARDVILSPRPDNTMKVAAASWEHLSRLESVDLRQLERFIVTNRNRSPEPGVRDTTPMNVPAR